MTARELRDRDARARGRFQKVLSITRLKQEAATRNRAPEASGDQTDPCARIAK